MVVLVAAVYGLLIGSFLNVVVYRLPLGIGLVRGRSFCPSCEHALGPADLVPVFSYLVLGGKCRYCSARISVRYLLVEVLTGVLFGLVAWVYGWSLLALGWLVVVACLVCVGLIDWDHQVIPDRFSVMIALVGVLFVVLGEMSWLEAGLGVLSVGGPLLLIALVSRGKAMGGGDIKLMAAIGLCFGWERTLLALFVGSLLGSVFSLIQIQRKRVAFGEPVAFGPFLVMGIFVSLFVGSSILDFYWGLF